jgi:hypothetical protein
MLEPSASKVTVAVPDSTTNTSSASVSVTVPGVSSQTPISTPLSSASSASDAVGAPASTDEASSDVSARVIVRTSGCSGWDTWSR